MTMHLVWQVFLVTALLAKQVFLVTLLPACDVFLATVERQVFLATMLLP